MARSDNILLKKMSGHIGKQFVIKQYGDKTIISSYPDMSNRKLSPKQVEMTKKMTDANAYARQILSDETKRNAAQLRLNVTRNRLYTALIRDYFQKLKLEAMIDAGSSQ